MLEEKSLPALFLAEGLTQLMGHTQIHPAEIAAMVIMKAFLVDQRYQTRFRGLGPSSGQCGGNLNPRWLADHDFSGAKEWLGIYAERGWSEEVSFLDLALRTMAKKWTTNAKMTLARWYEGRDALELLVHIPTPFQVFEMQREGRRCVSFRPDEFDLDFLLHDLEHAAKFFHDDHAHHQQRNFFIRLGNSMNDGRLIHVRETDSDFEKHFQSMISDMNTHPEHMRSTLRANLIHAEKRKLRLAHDQKLPASSESWIEEFVQSLH